MGSLRMLGVAQNEQLRAEVNLLSTTVSSVRAAETMSICGSGIRPKEGAPAVFRQPEISKQVSEWVLLIRCKACRHG